MEIAIFEDKKEELAKAQTAIEASNNIYATVRLGHRSADQVIIKLNSNNESAKIWDELAQEGLFKTLEHIKSVGGGIITDMMFRLTTKLTDEPVPPSGLLVVMHCLAVGVPVVVCTDASEVDGHHAKALHWIFDGYVLPADQKGSLPFGWVEDKDWSKAVKLLEEICSKKIKGGRR